MGAMYWQKKADRERSASSDASSYEEYTVLKTQT